MPCCRCRPWPRSSREHGERASRMSRSPGDPTTGGVWSSLVAGADVLISVPGARVSFSGSRTRPWRRPPIPGIPRRRQVGARFRRRAVAGAGTARRGRRGRPDCCHPDARAGRRPPSSAAARWPAGEGDGDGTGREQRTRRRTSSARAARAGPARTGGWRGISGRGSRSKATAAGGWIPACAADSAATRVPRSLTSRRPASGPPRQGSGPPPACSGWHHGSACQFSR